MAQMALNDAKETGISGKIGKRLRIAKKKIAITQAQLAGILGMNRAMVIDMEAGRIRVSNSDIVKLGKILRVRANWLSPKIKS